MSSSNAGNINVVEHTPEASLASPVSDSDTLLNSPQDTTSSDTFTGADPPAVIPLRKEHERRTLVLCFDGTGDQYGISLRSVMINLTPGVILPKV